VDQVKYPIFVTNFKTYESATGVKALELARLHQKVGDELGVHFAVAPQVTDIWMIASQVTIPVFAHHFDAACAGACTGSVLPESLAQAGADGSLLNHAEKRIPFPTIIESVTRAGQVGFYTLVCAQDLEEAKQIAKLKPSAVAIEPPELIGGDVSVSKANPDIIKDAVAQIDVPVIVGAGIKTPEDVDIALQLGAKGVLVASGVTRAEDPEKVLRAFGEVLKKHQKAE